MTRDHSTQRALLADLLRRQSDSGRPLSYPQQRLWFLDQLDPASAVYNIPLGYHITGLLDQAALGRALSTVVARHEVLRSVFHAEDGRPGQLTTAPAPIEIPVVDLAGKPDADAEVERLAREQARMPFDLSTGPLLRALLLRSAPGVHRFCLTIHHIVCDGRSVEVLGRELAESYAAQCAGLPDPLSPLPIQYADFARWQLRRQHGPEYERSLAYWREVLADAPEAANLPTDRPRPAVQNFRGAHLEFPLPETALAALSAVARRVGATPFAALLAAFAVLLRAYTGEDDIVVGTPIAGRARPELSGLIGFFANTLVLRVNSGGEPTFTELVDRVGELTRGALAHGEVPFEKLVEELRPDRDLARNPLFQVLFSYHDAEPGGWRLPDCEVTAVPGDSGTSKFDLSLSLTRTGESLSARMEYSTELFEHDTAERLARQYRTVVEAAAANPDLPIGRLPVLSGEQRRQVLVDCNDTAIELPGNALIHREFEARARIAPEAAAVSTDTVDATETVTYRELDERADALATRLRALGIGSGSTVGVYLDRSVDMVVALLGVLKAGGAYLPLDPGYPGERLAYMIADSRTAVVLTRSGLARGLAQLPVPVTVAMTDTGEVAGAAPDRGEVAGAAPDSGESPGAAPDSGESLSRSEESGSEPSPDGLAYVIYTSGSTGRPKGVMITHRNVVNFFAGMDARLGDDPGPEATWLAVTSISFDISVLELLWTLARGYHVILRADQPAAAPADADSVAPVPNSVRARPMDFSLFYFGGDAGGTAADRYRLLREGAVFADRNDFHAVWTPERHFHDFGGLYPNPATTGAALAALTDRVRIRAGSVVIPLHDPLRVAEEWSVVDNLSHGRVGISVASGWHANDFVFAPGSYADRKNAMVRGLEQVRALWRGGTVRRAGGTGATVEVGVFPPPVQPELPVWITSSRSPETFELAGELGAGLLTHLLGHSPDQLADKITRYRRAWRAHGHPGDGHVTLMLHAFAGPDRDLVRETVREPLCRYLKTSFDLIAGLGTAVGSSAEFGDLPEAELDALVHQAFDRFFDTAGLLGTPEDCADTIDRLKLIGVDEVACLIDFGVEHTTVLQALPHLARARRISEERRRAAAAEVPIGEQLRRHRVTHLQCTPALAGLLLDDTQARAGLRGLRALLVGGEALPEPLGARLTAAVGGEVHNMYGPTEATVWATTTRVRPAPGPIGIGAPLANVRAYVVDRWLRPAPVGAPGELLLGGAGIGRGYWNRPGLTADRFIPDPFSGLPGERLYRTGDLVRRRASGDLEFLGRLDHQIKIHGHRIELGEIENRLASHPAVHAAVASPFGAGAGRGLAAYYVAAPDAPEPRTAELREHLRQALPDHMVPAVLVPLPRLPLTPNGKVDRRALPDPARETAPRAQYRPPETPLQHAVSAVWTELLPLARVSIDDNFFEIGGNSLLAVQARSRLRDALGRELSLVDLFRYPTARTLAAALDDPTDGARSPGPARADAERRRTALMHAGGARRAGRTR